MNVSNSITNKGSLSIWEELEKFNSLQLINKTHENEKLINIINKFFSNFMNGINRNNYGSYINRSCKGVTDLTYICHKYLEGQEKVIKFVTKFIHPSLSANTRLCSQVLKHLGLYSPKIYVVDCEYKDFPVRGKIGSIMKINASQYKNHDFAFMDAFSGTNIGDFISTTKFFQLNEHCTSTMFYTFGRVAVFDLFLGNDDRFYRPATGLEFIAPNNVDAFINSGNIMLDIKSNIETTIELVVFCIDNTSSNMLNSSVNKNSEIDFEPEKEIYLQSFLKAFCYFKIHQSEFASKIYEGIRLEVDRVLAEIEQELPLSPEEKSHYFLNNDFATQYLIKGIEEGYSQLSNQQLILPNLMEEWVKEIRPNKQGDFYCRKILELANLCLQSLSKEENYEHPIYTTTYI
ncbi:MAG: hypothetical protein H0V82_03505 [Candidatus Protochlamydia sp.]|nr:hypothetical protein [Candidatus Protochlamydia sp.]